ncbi:MAG: sulfite exporter TauE/SafE family protein [Acidimicrobiia bacterium]
MAAWPFMVLAGAAIGTLTGLFGVGGSSIATPLLSLLGAPGLIAVASPLPATIPGAAVASIAYVRSGDARPRAAAWTLLGGVPAAIGGALLSRVVGGPTLLVLSGVVLVGIGLRVVQPIKQSTRDAGTVRRQNRPLLVLAAAGVGLFTGLLANGGGFLLVPLYLLVFGLRMRQAVGTSLLVIIFLAIPTLATHWALGHIDWAISGELTVGLVPASFLASRYAHNVEGPVLRRGFGVFLILLGVAYTIYRLTTI